MDGTAKPCVVKQVLLRHVAVPLHMAVELAVTVDFCWATLLSFPVGKLWNSWPVEQCFYSHRIFQGMLYHNSGEFSEKRKMSQLLKICRLHVKNLYKCIPAHKVILRRF